MMADDLEGYGFDEIMASLRALRRKGGRFCISAILDNIQAADGRPTPDKAWAMFPKDECASAVITSEMAEAWGGASEQYYAGDTVGAQIAFKREYAVIVEKARNEAATVDWFTSLGHEPSQRADALIEAAINRRITVDHAAGLLAHDEHSQARLIAQANAAGVLDYQTAQKYLPQMPDEDAKKKIMAQLHGVLDGKVNGILENKVTHGTKK